MKKLILSFFTLTVFLVAQPAFAEEIASKMPNEADMQKAMKIGMPSDAHKVLEQIVGNWTYSMTHKMAADAPEQASEGVSKNEWILGGRFIQQKVTSTFEMGKQTISYEGLGTIGYDNMKGQYISSWMDNMGTGMMTATAEYNPETKTLKEKGTYSCAMKGHDVNFTSELKFINDDYFTYTMYEADKNGKSYKMMDIKYTRQK